MSNPDLRMPESIRDFWQGAGGSVSHQQLEVQGFQVLKWPSYSLGSAADKDIMVQEDLCTPLLDFVDTLYPVQQHVFLHAQPWLTFWNIYE